MIIIFYYVFRYKKNTSRNNLKDLTEELLINQVYLVNLHKIFHHKFFQCREQGMNMFWWLDYILRYSGIQNHNHLKDDHFISHFQKLFSALMLNTKKMHIWIMMILFGLLFLLFFCSYMINFSWNAQLNILTKN